MKIDPIRKAWNAEPFVPFVLYLADGRRIPVLRRDLIAMAPNGRTIAVCQPDDSMVRIEMRQVTSMKTRKRQRQSA